MSPKKYEKISIKLIDDQYLLTVGANHYRYSIERIKSTRKEMIRIYLGLGQCEECITGFFFHEK